MKYMKGAATNLACAVIVAVFFLAFVAMAACSTTGERNERGDLVVTYAVMKLIEQSDDISSDRVISAVERVRSAVDGSAVTDAGGLQTLIMAQLDLDGLSPADQFLIRHVIGEIQTELIGEVEGGGLPEEYAVALEEWLSLIEAAAHMARETDDG